MVEKIVVVTASEVGCSGKALIRTQVTKADTAGLWTLQTSIFNENRASIALHRAASFSTLGVRERIAQRDGRVPELDVAEEPAVHVHWVLEYLRS
ncbi:N-acetyltransferase family protein [Amycolatopsis sp. MEPSY49]|uniref:GNAT family N-acetyltransferase n=1 Tax=Amycolatopsis sp. MEPSY49 TaxID=3151600 RepID=UPI003F5106E9